MESLRGRRRVLIRAPDPTLTPVSRMLAVSELVEQLHVTSRLDASAGTIKQRRRGHTAAQADERWRQRQRVDAADRGEPAVRSFDRG